MSTFSLRVLVWGPLCLAAMLLGLSALLAPTTAGAQQLPPTPFEIGQPFPEIKLPDLDDGAPRTIQDYRGKKVVLHIFASW